MNATTEPVAALQPESNLVRPPPARFPAVFTLTGNLLAERTLDFERWLPGKTQRAAGGSFQVGGKGINVSRMLSRLGVANTALCFVGGPSGAECETWLRERGFAFRAFATRAPTRTGTVVRDASGAHAETTFLGPDVAPDATAIHACADFLDAQPSGRVLALCGSFPGWPTSAFARLHAALDRWTEKGLLVVDTYGPPLADLIRRPLALLKINLQEFQSLGLERLVDVPANVRRMIITDGPRPVQVRDWDGSGETFAPPKVREVSATGSGDVLLACVLDAMFLRKLPLRDAVTFAIPYAAANAAHSGIAEFPLPGSCP